MLDRREFIKQSGFGLLGMGKLLELPFFPKKQTGPNVILIMTDDQGYGDLACLGNPWIKTPHLDALYRQSTRLTDFHVSPTCSPTRAALMSGCYNSRVGVWHTVMGRSLLARDRVTMADVFESNGYRTAIFGKWHLGDNYPYRPQDRGFEYTLVHGGGGVGQTPDYWDNDYFDDTYLLNGKPKKYDGYCTDVWFDEAIRYIEARRDQPFFVYLSTNAPHHPLNIDEHHVRPYMMQGIPRQRAKFYGMITNIDENIGKLRAKLAELQIEDNTILIFMTDNGTADGQSRGNRDKKFFDAEMRGAKASPYEGGHRVPLFVRWPGGNIPEDHDIDTLSAHIDVLPTLIDMCGLNKPFGAQFDGQNLWPLLSSQSKDLADRTIIIDSQRVEYPQKWRKSCVMNKQWRLINGEELYDIQNDLSQHNDIAADHPQVVEILRRQYENWWADISKSFDRYERIVIGSNAENPTPLTAMDWHTVIEEIPWNQNMIRDALAGNGFWAVEIARDGRYAFSLRRWPKEISRAINAYAGKSVAIHPVKARLRIGDIDQTIDIDAHFHKITFRVDLKKGPAKLQTWFIDADETARGAYYVEAEYVS